jgi:2-polyprenyl-6-methoxyphenol hydroxylase-like FAD-dependent oxidoreductase
MSVGEGPVIVVGGGIAGLTTALAAERMLPGRDLLLLEQSAELTTVGAGILLWPNALAVLERLGICAGEVDRVGRRTGLDGVRTADGRWLRRLERSELDRRVGPSAAFHRAELVDLLRGRLSRTEVRLGAQVSRVSADGVVSWRTGGRDETERAGLVVAADGIRSRVRSTLWDVAPVSSGAVAARAVVDVATDVGVEVWGRGAVAGHLPLRGGRTYVYAARRGPWDGQDLDWLASWPGELPRLAEAVASAVRTGGSRPHVDRLSSLPPVRPWVRGRVALVGDAAHAMLPFLGQGACQGIEDAEALVHAVAASGDLTGYERARRRQAQTVARASATASRVALADGRAAALRDRLLPLAPDAAYVRQLARWAAPRPGAGRPVVAPVPAP